MKFTEDEKSYDLLSASWRPRKASGVVQSKSKGLAIGKVEGLSLNARAQEQCPSREETNSAFLHLFVLFRLSVAWMMSTHIGDSHLLY